MVSKLKETIKKNNNGVITWEKKDKEGGKSQDI